jgi:peptidoglycan/xylan/chitin deacetylase (PgdA/CDA1 family)
MLKRNLLARGLSATGCIRLCEILPRRRCLTVLTYHRIGDPDETKYDPGTISATADAFELQVAHLKRKFTIIDLDQALSVVDRPESCPNGAVMLTFDDGYRDNYEVAFPILQSYGVPATFFLPTSFIATSRVPWWDAIAFALRHARRARFSLQYPGRVEVDTSGDLRRTIRTVLSLYKSPANTEPQRFLAELESRCETSLPMSADRLFLNWEEAAQMLRGGMAIGSHSHTHEVLSKLPPDEQLSELTVSREILEMRLSTRIQALSYPVGRKVSFNDHTRSAVSAAGYRAAFSHYGDVNPAKGIEKYDIRRIDVENDHTHSRFRLRVASAGAFLRPTA